MTSNLNIIILLIIITLFSKRYVHTERKEHKSNEKKSASIKKTIRKKYQINSSQPINPDNINIKLGLGKQN
ncbi:MAG: hypothetical protein ACOCQO_01630 [Halanaerobiaceae bacterium]